MKVVFLRILGMSFTASFLIAALILFRAMLKRTPKALVCGLWLLAAVRLICPFTIQSPFSILPKTAERVTTEEWVEDHAASTSELSALQSYLSGSNPVEIEWEAIPPASGIPEEKADAIAEMSDSQVDIHRVMGAVIISRIWVPVLSILWVLGMAVMLCIALKSYLQIHKKVDASLCIGGNIWICDYIRTPFVLGIAHPRIYLPSDMNPAHFHSVTAHELAHLQRHDNWWKPFAYLILSIHWFNPFVWAAYILFCKDIELACDEKVVQNMGTAEKKIYSEALLSLSISRKLVSAAYPLSFGEVGVKERIRTVLHYKKPALWAALLALAGSTVLAACFMTNPTPEEVEAGLNGIIGQVNGAEEDAAGAEEPLLLDGWIHFLLLGLDGDAEGYAGKRSDAIMVLSVNEEEEKVILSTIPRDTLVYISDEKAGTARYDKISHAYAYGGANAITEVFQENFDIQISGYVAINFQAMEEVVDLLGGLTLTLTDQEAKHMGDYYGAWGLEGGTQLLSGYEVLQYCRVRKIDSDYVRNDRQFTVLQEIYKSVRNLPATKYVDLINTIYPYVSTSLSTTQCVFLAETLLNLLDGQELINVKLVDNTSSAVSSIEGVSYILVDNLAESVTDWYENALGRTDYTPSERLLEISGEMTELRQSSARKK